MTEEIKRFNIRVYGILLNEINQVLLSDEYVMNSFMTKFPGGGMKFGEGPEDCILRECQEEFGQEVEIMSHFYTTGFFQKAMFYTDNQLISIYYKIRLKEKARFKISETSFDFPPGIDGSQSFRWFDIKKLSDSELSFPVDRYVAGLLKKDL